jgi:hypothetical protein
VAGDNAGIPKLFVNAEPGVIMRDRQRAICRGWPDRTEITVPGKHLVQEDSGAEIGHGDRRMAVSPRLTNSPHQ